MAQQDQHESSRFTIRPGGSMHCHRNLFYTGLQWSSAHRVLGAHQITGVCIFYMHIKKLAHLPYTSIWTLHTLYVVFDLLIFIPFNLKVFIRCSCLSYTCFLVRLWCTTSIANSIVWGLLNLGDVPWNCP